MLRPGGYGQLIDPVNGVSEHDTFTCCHCNKVVMVKPKASMEEFGGFCTLCFKPTCPRCEAVGTCTPFEKKLEEAEAKARFRCEVG